jgi:hypothetical protein
MQWLVRGVGKERTKKDIWPRIETTRRIISKNGWGQETE